MSRHMTFQLCSLVTLYIFIYVFFLSFRNSILALSADAHLHQKPSVKMKRMMMMMMMTAMISSSLHQRAKNSSKKHKKVKNKNKLFLKKIISITSLLGRQVEFFQAKNIFECEPCLSKYLFLDTLWFPGMVILCTV